MTADGTMTLCAKCRRVITAWNDVPLVAYDEAHDVYFYSAIPTPTHWRHFVVPYDDRHDPMPLPSTLPPRALHCANCHQPQVHDGHGWHCERCDHT